MIRIAIFTDADLGLNTEAAIALRAVLRHGGSEIHPRIFTAGDLPADTDDYFATPSVGFRLPWDRQQRVFWPRVGPFARQLRAGGEHLVHIATTGPVGLAGCWLARRAGVPIIASVHAPLNSPVETFGPSSRISGIGERLAHWAFGSSESILVPSNAAAAALAARGFNRVHAWPRGVDSSRFAPGRASSSLQESWHVDHRRPAILVPLSPLARPEVEMIEPIRRSLHRHAIAHQFVFVGRHQTGVDLHEVCPDGVFIENCSNAELAVVMASAHLCFFPGAADVPGGMVLEAQACGLPAIVAEAGGAREQVLAGRTACLVRAGDVGDATSSLTSLLRNAGRRAEMGRAARAHALEHDWRASLIPLHRVWRAARRGRPEGATQWRPETTNEAAWPGVTGTSSS